MKITLILDCELSGIWLPEYEDEMIDKLRIPGVLSFGGDDNDSDCDVIVENIEWGVEV
jgi:hypothetical protein